MKLPVYLDYMATTPVDPRVAAYLLEFLTQAGNFGNPASRSHQYGWLAEAAVENARQQVANLINAQAEEIIWTSGGTEANNLALKGAARFYKRQGKHIITCLTEHQTVLQPCIQLQREGFEVSFLKPQANGLIDLNTLKTALRKDTILVSLMHANNEIGVIQDIKAIGELTRQHGILLHVDAVQSAGKIPIDVQALAVDLLSLSAHKIYGPKGVGALFVRAKPRLRLEPLLHGGEQERGLRPGTLAVHQIAAMGLAFEIAQQEMLEESKRILQLRQQLWGGLQKQLKNIHVNGDKPKRLPGNLNVSFSGVDAQPLMASLNNLAVSSGSACTSGNSAPSHVLQALGLSDTLARSAIRFSLGRFTTTEEIEFAILQITKAVQELRLNSAFN